MADIEQEAAGSESETCLQIPRKQKFKFKDLQVAMTLFEQGERMCSFDLKSRYHHLDVIQHHHKYFEFKWGEVFTHL